MVVAGFAGSTGGGYEIAAAQSRIWSPDGVVAARATLTRPTSSASARARADSARQRTPPRVGDPSPVDAASASTLRELTSGCGALIAGRRLFDQTDGWGDNHPAGAPVVVVTHRPPPEDAAGRFPRTTFTASVEEGVATAKEIAGDKFATIASADIIQQALNLGLVDELCISHVPVLFGSGIRYFGELAGGHVMLEDPVVVQGTRALHLRYPVRR